MADEVPGINMLIAQAGTAIAAQSGATLSTSTELAEAIVKSTNFSVKNSGDQDWTLSHEGQIEDDTGKHALTNGNAALRIPGESVSISSVDTTNNVFTLSSDKSDSWSAGDVVRISESTDNDGRYTIASISGVDVTVEEDVTDSTGDGTMTRLPAIPGLQSITLSMEQELNETPPGIDAATGWSYYTPLRRDWTIEMDGHYYHPQNDPTYKTVNDAIDEGEQLDATLDVLGLTFSGAIANDSREIEAGTDDNAAYSFSFGGSDTLSKSGSAESTISSLLDLYFNQSSATVALKHKVDGSVVKPSTTWSGSAYISSLEIELARNEYPSISGEFQGDGALTREPQTASDN